MSESIAAAPTAQVAMGDIDGTINSILNSVGSPTQAPDAAVDGTQAAQADIPVVGSEAAPGEPGEVAEPLTEGQEAEAAQADEAEELAEATQAEEAQKSGQPLTRRQRQAIATKWAWAAMDKLNGGSPTGKLDPDLLPSIDDLVNGQEAFVVQQQMAADFTSADPAAHERFVAHWNAQNPQAMTELAKTLLPTLAKTNPEAAHALHSQSVNRFVDGLYQTAMRQPDPNVAEQLLHAAQMCEWHITGGPNGGRYRNSAGPQATPDQQQQQGVSPELQMERAARIRLQQQLQQVQGQQQNEQVQSRQAGLNAALTGVNVAKTDPILLELKKVYVNEPKVFDAIAKNFREEVLKGTEANVHQRQLFEVAYARALRGDAQAADEAQKRWTALVSQSVANLQPQYLRASKNQISQASAQRHAELRQASEQRAAPPNSGSVSRPVVAAPDFSKHRGNADATIAAILGLTS